jgi:hypothetical protein
MSGVKQWPRSIRGGAVEDREVLDPNSRAVIVPLSSDGVDPRMWGEMMDRFSARARRGGSMERGVVITARKQVLRERVQLTGRGPTSGFRLLPAHEGPRSCSQEEIIQEPTAEWVSIHIPLDASQSRGGRITIGVDQAGRRSWRQITAVVVALSGLVFGAAVTMAFQAWSDERTPVASTTLLGGKQEGYEDRSAAEAQRQGRLESDSPARKAAGPEVPSRVVSSPLPAARPKASARAARARARRLWRLRRAWRWRWRRLKARRYVRLARRALSVGRIKLATKHATRAVRLDPRNRLARKVLAKALKQLKLSRVLRDLWLPALPVKT